MSGWNLPPGVTGREPEISGELGAEQLQNEVERVRKLTREELRDLIALLEDQGVRGSEIADLDKLADGLDEELGSVSNLFEEPDPPEPEYDPEPPENWEP